MIVCICNNITENDIAVDANLAMLIGSCCGTCVQTEFVEAEVKVLRTASSSLAQLHQKNTMV